MEKNELIFNRDKLESTWTILSLLFVFETQVITLGVELFIVSYAYLSGK